MVLVVKVVCGKLV
ncbi:hypothetical protein M2G69_22200 [Vibrio vulnificus]|nr:hypothetical protein [Vibrio vulnificus]MDE1229139.1 hypothetical protein [Vibrio aestuarianus]MCU8111634.1 hypothetical protein [Vibrio vulnificus]MCU8111837.1 hypothetical protein [Vibrio vulnificus]MCU8120458.1 hypothetical protein [Vibrio vulnificus]